MIIYFVRHASAGQQESNPRKDEKRPLDSDGIEQCNSVGRALAALDVQPDVIISSPLKRATQTASLIGNEMGHEGKLQLEQGLRPEASFAEFRRMLEKYARHEAIMVVGHNPSITDFLARLIAKSGSEALIDFKKGAVARAETGRNSATLNWFFTPKIARAIQTAAEAAAEKSHPKTSRK
jgi:phosphohistidine phosphatase